MKACEAFVRAGHEVELVVPARKSPIKADSFAYYGIKNVFPLKRIFTIDTVRLGSIGYIWQSIFFGKVAALYAWFHKSDVLYGRDEITLAVAGLLTRRKMIWESHDGAWNIWARYLVRRASGIVVVTQDAVDFYKEKGVPEARLFAISNGIDLDDFARPESKEVARARLGLPQDAKTALYIGKLDGWKGVDTLLEASLLLSETRVAIIGGEKNQIEELSKKYSKVIFVGFRPYAELADNQAAADVLVVPNTGTSDISVRFTSPLKLIAHLASGRPIVVSDLPSTRFIADGAALFVQPDDPKALAEGIEEALTSPTMAQELIQKARERVVNFSWSKRAQRISAFIKDL
jgi:glycosyltransferase involved in cell wall biosynthesis